ncbi:uncharacterized protein A4U43_C07F2850 [Asparagus officinalis]|uniref:VWFA domain-containing protein n=1 Tax=Asparagus officinalis TaxID=4686 RepID=A0A5P1EAV9_ASPOF|nr:uncharacterized protein A4U43_C07F2850 [Asparagus officinalis]
MVQDLLEKGKLKNCIAVCDVSGSMSGTPMDVCVALGMLTSELSEEPWKGRVITFSAEPQLHRIEGEKLVDKMEFVNTDFQKVFDRLLDVAKKGNLEEDQMITRVFVFSDMEFDQALANSLDTDYEVICKKFRDNGYRSCIPEVVFWNLRDSRSTPVPSGQKGVALVSGFLKNLMKVFLEGDGDIDPVKVMEDALARTKEPDPINFQLFSPSLQRTIPKKKSPKSPENSPVSKTLKKKKSLIPKCLSLALPNSAGSSGNPALDFFFQVVPDTAADVVFGLLSSAWAQDALTALKLVAHLRGVRGTGKSDKEGFYASALWLHENHPKTLALNVGSFAEFGYMKDLLEILYRLLNGRDTRKLAKDERNRAKSRGVQRWRQHRASSMKKPKKAQKAEAREKRVEDELAKMKMESEKAAGLRRSKRTDLAKLAIERYNRDPNYRFLHDRISEFFAAMLESDAEQLKLGNLNKIGLAAKWCPSLDSSFDRWTLMCESIARRLWPKDSTDEYKETEEEHYAYRVRDRLRREVLVPLRKALELPEAYMSAGKWDQLPYRRVASVAMKNYTKIFKKHDEARFSEYLSRVKEGKEKIAAGALLPHEILASAHDKEAGDVAELQWNRMVQDLLEKGKLKNCIAVCDVSGSMSGTPMDVCVALGMLISELSEEPWKGRVITFSANPQLHRIEGEKLVDKMEFVKRMDWGMNTDFQKVFDRLLDVAKKGNLKEDQMIKRVFVFSDMEFDQASACSWETDYEVICKKFRDNGYGSCIPEIVFWNLRDSRSTPVPSGQKGVALVSGFSKNLVKIFLEGDGDFSPVTIMEDAISGKEYQKLVVFD